LKCSITRRDAFHMKYQERINDSEGIESRKYKLCCDALHLFTRQ
jgi:hypothetical protein